MIPILFDTGTSSFSNNGLGRLRDCISCTVTEERNGIYECDFEYPVGGQNYDLIKCGRIIGVTHDDTDDIQPFDIVSCTRPINGIVSFHAVHISYRQSFLTVKTTKGINSLSGALTLLENAEPSNPFSYWTNKTSSAYFGASDGTPRTVKELLGGIEGSILDTYGGEYEFDGFAVKLYVARGQSRNFTIRYGVNMTEYNDETDVSETYNSVIPYWTDGEKFVVGDMVTDGETVTGRGECVPLDVSDRFESKPTKAQVQTEGLNIIKANRPYLPAQTISVSFARLQDIGYEWLSDLYRCNLCDTINVSFPAYGMTGSYKIVKTVWNVLENHYESMELGALSTTLSEALGVTNGSVSVPLGGLDSSLFELETKQLFASQAIASGAHIYDTVNFTKSGYYPLCIAGWNSPNAVFVPSRLRLTNIADGSVTVAYDVCNPRSSSGTSNFNVDILWLKTD